MDAPRQLTYRQAAKRVHRSVRQIKQWRHDGMPMGVDERGRRTVDERVLLAEYRRRLNAWPAHRYRMRSRDDTLNGPDVDT